MVWQVISKCLKRVERVIALEASIIATASWNMCPQDAADKKHMTAWELNVVSRTVPAATTSEVAIA